MIFNWKFAPKYGDVLPFDIPQGISTTWYNNFDDMTQKNKRLWIRDSIPQCSNTKNFLHKDLIIFWNFFYQNPLESQPIFCCSSCAWLQKILFKFQSKKWIVIQFSKGLMKRPLVISFFVSGVCSKKINLVTEHKTLMCIMDINNFQLSGTKSNPSRSEKYRISFWKIILIQQEYFSQHFHQKKTFFTTIYNLQLYFFYNCRGVVKRKFKSPKSFFWFRKMG